MRILLAILLLVACKTAEPEPTVTKTKTETFEAVLDIDRLSQGKGLQGTWLVTKSERLIVSYSPVPDYVRFLDRKVVVTGERWMPGQYEQHIDAPHFKVESIALADGETEGPATLEPPILVTTLDDAKANGGRWIEVHGTLSKAEKHADDDWCDATVELEGGAVVTQMHKSDMEASWTPLVGKEVTVLGRVFTAADGRLELGPASICPGRVRGCGMDTP